MNLTVVLSFLPATTPLLLFHIPLLIFLIQSYLLPSIQPLPFPPSLSLSQPFPSSVFDYSSEDSPSLPALIFFWFPSPRCSLFLRQNIRERRGWDTGCVCAFVCVCAASSLCAGVYITPIRARIHRLASSVNTTAVYPRFQRQIQSR